MKRPACLNDPTSHGGKVITASSSYVFDGRRAALPDDLVSCPLHGDNPLIEGDRSFTDQGRPLVTSGCRSQCGAIVLMPDTRVSIA